MYITSVCNQQSGPRGVCRQEQHTSAPSCVSAPQLCQSGAEYRERSGFLHGSKYGYSPTPLYSSQLNRRRSYASDSRPAVQTSFTSLRDDSNSQACRRIRRSCSAAMIALASHSDSALPADSDSSKGRWIGDVRSAIWAVILMLFQI